jgi:ABC-2 type transport system permease protein
MNLLRNEFLKLHAKKGSYIFAGFLLIVSCIILTITKNWLPPEMKIGHALEFAKMNMDVLLSFVVLYGIVIVAKTLTEEFQKGTIKQLLIRPKKRLAILFSKYIALLLVITGMTLFAAVISLLIGAIAYGGGKVSLLL